ncbi:hypothetical protein HU200_012376 [Digitaria exilis]|uniref:glutathione transferase n=1 Tax=Digitaria exilis TaxID=1010633 RepID=A0A835KLX3_9POAL|nr:hypothetical protein HU200_012376 [Digitaria exilis]
MIAWRWKYGPRGWNWNGGSRDDEHGPPRGRETGAKGDWMLRAFGCRKRRGNRTDPYAPTTSSPRSLSADTRAHWVGARGRKPAARYQQLASSKLPATLLHTMAGEHDEITLLGLWASPFVIRARILHESNIILQYLDEAFPATDSHPILPADPYNRAVARFWASYVDDKVFGTWLRVSTGRTNEERVEAARQVVAALQTLEKEAFKEEEAPVLFAGDTSSVLGLVDVVLGSLLGWLHATEAICGVKVIDGAKMPALAAWAERFRELDCVKGLIPDAKRLVEYNMLRRARKGLPMLSPYVE